MNEPRDVRPEAPESAPPGAAAMTMLRRVLVIGLAVLALGSGVAWWMSRSAGPSGVAEATTYYCPMHPSYTSDRKGECPFCGMDLEPAPTADSTGSGSNVAGLSVVEIGPERLQLIGVRTAVVESTPLGSQTPLVAFVAPDESRLRRVQLRVPGWVQTLNVARTGDFVGEGQPLLTIYSPELYQSELEFLIAIGAAGQAERLGDPSPRPVTSHDDGGRAVGRERLRLLGVPTSEISRLERELRAASQVTMPSPVTGTVLERHVTEGQFVDADMPLLTVADLSRVWVVADLYEMDLVRVRKGDRAVFTADGLPGREFASRIDFVSPVVSTQTRTAQARIELSNADGTLRPGMYGRLQVQGRAAPSLTVPSDAVIRTGSNEYVFVARAGGRFEPREVRTGVRDGERTEVRDGLAVGDTVVAGASFLIDSESRLKAALSGMSAPSRGSQP